MKRTTRAVAFHCFHCYVREQREKEKETGRKTGKTRKELGEWVETMGRWPRAAVAGRQVESEIQKHEARSVENERHLRKRHVEVVTNQKLGRHSMEIRDGTEVG